jgi:hypothetical protein
MFRTGWEPTILLFKRARTFNYIFKIEEIRILKRAYFVGVHLAAFVNYTKVSSIEVFQSMRNI